MDPEVEALINYLLTGGGGMNPSLDPASFNTLFGQIPQEYNSKGVMEPMDLTNQAKAANYLQDRNQLQVDPVTAAQAGLGAFGPQAFDPIVDMQPVNRPGQQLLDYYTSRANNTIEYLIADEIANGGSAASAMAKIRRLVEDEPADEEAAALQQAITSQLPTMMTKEAGVETTAPDFNFVQTKAQELEKALATDPVANFVDENGQAFLRNETPSPMTQWFQKMGLPLPTEQYSLDYAMGPEWSQQRDVMSAVGAAPLQAARAAQSKATKDERETSGAMARFLTDRAKYAADMDRYNAVDPNQSRGLALAGINAGGYIPTPGAAAQGAVQAGTNPMPVAPERPTVRLGGTGWGGLDVPLTGQAVKAKQRTLGRKRGEYQAQRADYNAMINQMFGPEVFAKAAAARSMQEQGRTPLQDALLQRRMASLAAGLQGA